MKFRFALLGIAAGAALALDTTGASADGPAGRGSVRDASYAPLSWGGLYVGVHAGYAWGDVDWTTVLPQVPQVHGTNNEVDGFIGGGHIGLQHQWGNIVVGGELSLSGTDLGDTKGAIVDDVLRDYTADIDWMFLATLRLGYASDRWLYYVKGGYAQAAVEFTHIRTPDGLLESRSREREHGWTVGAGVEYALQPGVIFGVEYNYIHLDIDDRLDVNTPGPLTTNHVDADADLHTVMARLSFKFGRDEPVARPMK